MAELRGDRTGLLVGYAEVEITPPVGSPLSDTQFGAVMTGKGRFSNRLRDPLFARALHIQSGGAAATLVIGDLLVITSPLKAAVCQAAGLDPDELLLAATHTHSGPGGYWDAGRAQRLVGQYQESIFRRLVEGLAEAARKARSRLSPARLLGATARVPGGSSNRRQLHGPVDPDLTLLRFEPEREAAIDLVSFGAHPVIGTERENQTISADFPGELCARIARHGKRALFFQGVVGGLSPLFPEFPMKLDEHLELVGGVLERAWQAADKALVPIGTGRLESRSIRVQLGDVSCRVLPRAGAPWELAEAAFSPLKHWVMKLGSDGRSTENEALLHLVRLGDAALLGTPCDLGVNVGLELKARLRAAGVRLPIVGSQCNGYVGYVHMPEDYAHVPEKGFRELAFYENAMSMAGWRLGAEFVAAVERAVDHPERPPTRIAAREA